MERGIPVDGIPTNSVRWIKGWAAAVTLIGIVLSGCSGGARSAVRVADDRPTVGERSYRIAGVPFVPGDPGACGPAALSSVLAYWGDQVSVEEIARALAVPSLNGVLPLDLARFAADRAPHLTTTIGSIDWLRDELRRDHPVLVFLDLGIGPWRRGHFVVVIGYRDASREVLMYSGRNPDAVMSYTGFVRAWTRGGSWALAHPPSDSVLRSPFHVGVLRVGVQHVEPLRADVGS
ncbi:MAG: C39 family peptidase [Nitrospirae bacterium]|nr:C39 family peptidase [Nitrospirota bacterium]